MEQDPSMFSLICCRPYIPVHINDFNKSNRSYVGISLMASTTFIGYINNSMALFVISSFSILAEGNTQFLGKKFISVHFLD